LYLRLTPHQRNVFIQLWPDVAADWLRLRPQQPDPEQAAVEQAGSLVQSGVGAFHRRRRAEAIRNLESARDLLRALLTPSPNDNRLSRQLGLGLRFLGSALRDSHRPVEALAAFREARMVLESINNPAALDLYNLACDHSQLSVLVEHAPTPPSAAERDALADQAIGALRRSVAAGMKDFALIDGDHTLDPLRERPEFQAILAQAKAGEKANSND